MFRKKNKQMNLHKKFRLKHFFSHYKVLSVKISKKSNSKKKEQTNEQIFLVYIHLKEIRPYLPPPPLKKILLL